MTVKGRLERYVSHDTTVMVAEGTVSAPPMFGEGFAIMTEDGLYRLPHTTEIATPEQNGEDSCGDFTVSTGVRYRLTVQIPTEFLPWMDG